MLLVVSQSCSLLLLYLNFWSEAAGVPNLNITRHRVVALKYKEWTQECARWRGFVMGEMLS